MDADDVWMGHTSQSPSLGNAVGGLVMDRQLESNFASEAGIPRSIDHTVGPAADLFQHFELQPTLANHLTAGHPDADGGPWITPERSGHVAIESRQCTKILYPRPLVVAAGAGEKCLPVHVCPVGHRRDRAF